MCYADVISASRKEIRPLETAPARTPGETFRRRMQEARKARGWSQRELATRLKTVWGEEKGQLTQAAVARIEIGERKVSLDEAVAIAAVLDVALTNMFLPIDGLSQVQGDGHAVLPGSPVRLAPALEIEQRRARAWAQGHLPLRPEDFEVYLEQSPMDAMVSPAELPPERVEELQAKWLRRLRSIGYTQDEEQR